MPSHQPSLVFLLAAVISTGTVRAAAQEQPPQPHPELHRWIDLHSASVEFRYRYIQTSLDELSAKQLQHRQRLSVGFKFDREGRYSIQTYSGTGSRFPSSWNNTGWGTGDANWPFAMRQFYVSAKPIAGVTAQVGGFNQYKGVASEITTFDNDNYMVGYRASVKRPDVLFLDDVTVTLGHVGDFFDANVFKRLDRLGDHNYTQLLVGKDIGSHVRLSIDWEEIDEVSIFHQAVRVSTGDWSVVHGIRFEQYQSVNGDSTYGFAIAAERALMRRLEVEGGYAYLDGVVPFLNGDKYSRGKRFFGQATVSLSPELEVEVYYGHAFDNPFFVANDQRFDVVLSYDVVSALKRSGIW